MKKFTCAFLSLLLILSLALLPVYADDTTDATVGYSADLVVAKEGLADLTDITEVTDISAVTEVKITNAAGMQKLAELVNANTNFTGKTVYLANDIDMTDVTNWTPIGNNDGGVWGNNSTPAFQGTFDGQGHAIKNLKVSSSAASNFVCVAIFGKLYNGTIKNLVIHDTCSFEYTGGWNTARTAALVAFMFNSNSVVNKIYNVQNNAAVTANAGHVGGLIGTGATWYGGEANAITNCTNTGKVTATGKAWAHGAATYDSGTASTEMGATAGGLVGNLGRGTVAIVNCNNTGAISAAGYAGGMIAGVTGNEVITIRGCTNSGSVTGLVAGGMVGEYHNGGNAVSGCTNAGKITTTDSSAGSAGHIIGVVNASAGTVNVSDNTALVDDVKVLGYQRANTTTTIEGKEGTYRSVRLVGTVTASEEILKGYELVGLKITATYGTTTKEATGTTKSVYKSLSVMTTDTTDTPDPLPALGENEYYFAIVLENMPTTLDEVALTVVPYYIDTDGVTCAGEVLEATISVND
ncbi:MAG: hypothetical protein IJW55_08500 [Clostridia bacterium]|nr:hypothetical protein [Clostridia bacterium]